MKRPYQISSLIALIGFGLFAGAAHAQDLSAIKRNFDKYAQGIPHEKIFVHTDRKMYLSGELMWFKLYTVDAGTNAPVDMSKVAYVEVLNDANTAILQGKIGLRYGTGNGSFAIPNTIANGTYKLRAYTAWMKNFSAELYFEQQITIVNPLAIPAAPLKQPVATTDISFFPEGGSLVNGLSSTVGFKALGNDGKGVDVSGAIVDMAGNDTVARFRSAKFGMGHFNFAPAADHSYKAIVKARGTTISKDLPAAKAEGYVMQVNYGSQVQIKITGNAAIDASKPLYLLAHQGATVSTAQQIQLGDDRSYTLQIDQNKLGDGINHITLFDAAQRPLSERLVFKRPALLSLQAITQQQYGRRKKASIGIAASSANGGPQAANMSVAVFAADAFNGVPDADIASYLHLTSELKGQIESPGYYFSTVHADANAALDDLLLTQGWSRFNWADALSELKPTFRFLPEYNGHLISGKLSNVQGGPGRFAVMYLSVVSKKPQLFGANSGSKGDLIFNTHDLYGNNELVLQTNPKVDTNTYKLSLNNPFSEEFSAAKLPPFYITKSTATSLEGGSLGMQTQTLFRPERMNMFGKIDSTAFYLDQFRTFKLDNYVRFITIEEVIREYVTSANVAKSGGHFHVKVMDPYGIYIDEGREDPLIMIDGIPVFNLDKVFTVDPLKVQTLTLANQKYYLGPIRANGVIALNTYKTDLAGIALDPKAVVLDYEGLQLQREFYSPVYDTPDQQKSRLPDLRNLLYWAPNVDTGTDGKAQLSFFTSDKAGKYIGVIQGLTGNGLAGSGAFTFDVLK